MNEGINLVEILKNFPRDFKLWSDIDTLFDYIVNKVQEINKNTSGYLVVRRDVSTNHIAIREPFNLNFLCWLMFWDPEDVKNEIKIGTRGVAK